MRALLLTAALAASALSLAVVPEPADAGRLKQCGHGRGLLVNNIRHIRARNTSCREARRVVKNIDCANDRCTKMKSRGKAGRYNCTVERLGYERSRQRCRGPGRRRVGWISQA